MASDLLPYALFGGNVSENVAVSKVAEGNDRNYASPNIWKLDQGIDVDSAKQEVADISDDWIANCNTYQWSAGQGEILQGDWVLNDKRSMSLAPKEVCKDNENMKVGDLDIPGSGQRGFSRETRVREMDLKTAFTSITEWFDDFAVDSEELDAAAQIESQNRQFDMKYLLAGLWEIGHYNLEDICTSVGKPGNIVREDNVLFAEWGVSNSFRKSSKEQVENQRLLGCNDYRANANASIPKDKANQEKQKILAPSWNAMDIMLDFHVPENHKENLKEHGEYFGTKLGSNLNRMPTRIGNLACEAATMEKGIFPLGEEENDIISKLAGDGQWLEHIFGIGTVLEGTNIVPKFINPYSGDLHLVKENSLTEVHQRCQKVDIAEHTACSPGMAFTDGNNSEEKGIWFGEFKNCSDREVSGGLPHEAIFFTLAYLPLQDLLSVERVCKSLRAAVKNDELLWRHLHVEHPLSKKFTNDSLIQLSSRAQGHLQCLSLVECLRVTDEGLKVVLDSNPNLTKLCLPGCTRVSAEGIVQIVKDHTENNRNGMSGLKHLRIRGLYGLTKDHLDNLKSSVNGGFQQQTGPVKPQFYHNGHYSFTYDDDRSIDVEVCPKCDNARLVYDCTRERCQQRKDHKLQQCRGCIFCIARCEECGRCIDDNEYEETFCLDLLCSSCWLQLPKCLECNRPGCGRHADHFMRKPDTTFVCGDCRGVSAGNLGPDFHGFA
ncbi:hypothetical protein SUGI_1018570 [Cryptomeria japonica]|uniref:uncharacterized protein LOC131052413 n=1 Tax=Cryptomeria japonica TaxID=3369 RepID=UPI002414B41B|nr:uncharacterized protein LOC131052413 [Cryptomeria japonica]GLJ48244.1 hypothetical protein SUGI_1018570 [Cryptomeria japonica]